MRLGTVCDDLNDAHIHNSCALQAGLPKEVECELNNVIQNHFKEWLASNALLRQIYDLSNLEKDSEVRLNSMYDPV